jgi:acyl transferase domain-containing protein/acyl carrier protein
MNAKPSTVAPATHEPIAIVGMGCRFPGGSSNPEKFWSNLLDGKDCIVDVPAERWDSKRFYDSNREMPGKVYVNAGGFLQERIDEFDALFFGISPREAASLDPQQRMLLEVSWEALEDAGIDPDSLAGSDTGVYVGGFMLDNKLTQLSPLNRHSIAGNTAVGMTLTLLANRLSYVYDMKGPSMSIDTACSSSMVALDQACRAIWSGDSALALVGGVNIMHRPEIFIAMCKGGFLSPDGRSKAFDERADGYGRGEGAAIVVLKPLSAAQRDNDQIYALVRATGCNQDGRTDGITVPNPASQQALIRKVAAQADVALHDIAYFEAHGTGTAVGDPIEMSAIGGTIGQGREDKCIVGSVKGNIGHLEAASGIAAVIKSALCLKYRKVPPQANLINLNPKIPFDALNIHIPRQVEALAPDAQPIYSGINSFGYGGTNACAILQSYQGAAREDGSGADLVKVPKQHVVALSAKSRAALQELAASYLPLTAGPALSLADLSYSCGARRAHLPHRLVINGADMAQVRARLEGVVAQQEVPGVVTAHVNEGRSKLAFVFTGMGPQWWGMGRELMQTEPVFLAMVERCDALFQPISGWSILEEMRKPEAESIIGQTQVAQPANFVLQVALVELWKSWGVTPAAVVGHSVGEVTTSYVSGILSLEQALLVSYHRSRIQKKAANQGAMLAVSLSEADAVAVVARHGGKVSIAAINAPTSITLAGDDTALAAIAAELTERGIFNRQLQVEVAYHSPTMDPLLDEIRNSLAPLTPALPAITTFSTATGRQVDGVAFDAEYWCRNVRDPVYFYRALENMIDAGFTDFLEIGPHPVLSTSIKECFDKKKIDGFTAASLNRKVPEQEAIKQCLAHVHARGHALDWTAVAAEHALPRTAAVPASAGEFVRLAPQFVRLPTYPWQRERYWNDSELALADRAGQPIALAVLGARQAGPAPTWISQLNRNYFDYLPDHRVEGLVVLAGASYVEAALAASKTLNGSDACLISGLTLHNALVLDAGFETELQTACDDGRFAIHSFPAHDRNQNVLHASGNIAPLTLRHQESVDLHAIEQRCNRLLVAAQVYAELTERGLQYGPYFQGIEGLRRRDGEVLARVVGHADLAAQAHQFQLHPTLLDACFQALISALPEDSPVSRQVYVPVEIEQLRLYSRPGRRFYCHGVLHAIGAQDILGDLTLIDDDGTVLVEIKNLRCQALRSAATNKIANLDDWTYQSVWRAAPLDDVPASDLAHTKTVLFLDAGAHGERLRDAFAEQHGDALRTVYRNADDQDAAAVARLFAELAADEGTDQVRLVFGWGMEDDPADPIGRRPTRTLLDLVKRAATLAQRSKVRLFVLTRQAAKVVLEDRVDGVRQSSLIGLGRVTATEQPALACTLIDVDGDLSRRQADAVALECRRDGTQQELALRGDLRYVQRLARQSLADTYQPTLAPGAAATFELARQGADGQRPCQFQATERSMPRAGEIECEIDSCLLDDDDLPLDDPRDVCARVTAVGARVADYRVGDALLLKYHGRLARHVILDAAQLLALRMPAHWDVRTAAPAVTAFAAAWSGLVGFANVQAGQRVLILGADSAAGQAAHRLARQRGCTPVLACAGKRSVDTLLPPSAPVFDLGAPALAAQLDAASQGAGFDVVFNAAGHVECLVIDRLLATGGKYVHVGTNGKQAAAPVGPNKMAMTIDCATLLDGDPARARDLLAKVAVPLADAAMTALDGKRVPLAAFPARAFERDARPLVLSFQDAGALPLVGKAGASVRIKPDASYLITGGFGGFGLSTATWLAAQGARHLVLVGRSGPASAEARATLTELTALGVHVKAVAADIGDAARIEALFAELAATVPPLKGIFHAAGVLDDRNLLDIDDASLDKVMLPKALGAWHLHQASLPLALDCFVLYSSISALIGNRNQGNYVAANTFLDALAHHRQALGLAATSINWGALADVGMAASNASVLQHLAHMGIHAFTPEQALEALAALLQSPVAQAGIFDVDWQRWKQYEPASAATRYGELLAADTGDGEGEQVGWAELLQRQGEVAVCAAVAAQFKQQIAATLKLPLDVIDQGTPISKFGLDSLTAMDLQMKVRAEFKVEISILELMKGNNIDKIAASITQKLAALQPQDEPVALPEAAPSPETDLIAQLDSLDSLSEEELDKLLGNALADPIEA